MEELRKIPGHDHEIIMPENYAIIERVYTWHPSIPNVGGKSVIAHLYAYGGMMVIRDMCARAEKAMAADAEIRALRETIAHAQNRMMQIQGEVCAV